MIGGDFNARTKDRGLMKWEEARGKKMKVKMLNREE